MGISAQVLSIAIGDITNPANPEKSYAFGVQTYYNWADLLSKVELGSNLFSMVYSYRSMNIMTSNGVYSVNQSPALFQLQYIPGVDLPLNLKITFVFSSYMYNIVYKGITINGISVTFANSQVGSTIILIVGSNIVANSNVVISFEFKAPPSVSYYNAISNI